MTMDYLDTFMIMTSRITHVIYSNVFVNWFVSQEVQINKVILYLSVFNSVNI